MPRLLVVVLTGALAAVPARAQEAAPVDGGPADTARLVGEWAGGYACEETGRHGALVFRLDAGADSLVASILMTPRSTGADVPTPIPLVVHHVRVEGRSLHGSLARYDDPEWGLPLETTFRGALVGADRVEGSFHAVGTDIDTIPQCGRWWATRVASPAGAPRRGL